MQKKQRNQKKNVPTDLVITAPQNGLAGLCIPIQVSLINIKDKLQRPKTNTVIEISDSSQSSIYSDSNCSNQTSQQTLPKDNSSLNFYMRSTLAGSHLILATTPFDDINDAEAHIEVLPGYVDHLGWTTQPSSSVEVDAPIANSPQVRIFDAWNNPVTAPEASISVTPSIDSECHNPSLGTLSMLQNPTTTTSGVATFSNISYSKSETIYLKASSPEIRGSACPQAVVVNPHAGTNVHSLRVSKSNGGYACLLVNELHE